MRERLKNSWLLAVSLWPLAKVDSRQKAIGNESTTIASTLPIVNCLFLSSLLIILLIIVSCTPKEKAVEQYTCPMHPTVISDKQGSCPVCGMDLVRKAREGEEVQITEDLNKLLPSTNEVIVSSIKTIKGEFKSMAASLPVQGIVTYDTRNQYSIPARISGRLEKVYLKYAFQKVSKGQKVAETYSPELLTAQRELLYVVENDADNQSLIESAKRKLQLLGFSAAQTEELIKKKEASATVSIYSQYDGYVITGEQPEAVSQGSASTAMNGGMGNSSISTTNKNLPETLIRQGDYVTTGQVLFKVANTSSLRIEFNLPLSTAGSIQMNDEVNLNLDKNEVNQGKVDFIQPFLDNGQEFVKIRLYTSKMKVLQIGQLVQATIQLKPSEGLWIPSSAVLNQGINQIVFVKDRGVFKPKEIKTQGEVNGWIQVTGLASSDEIASDAHYLVDSEDFIKTKN